MQDALSGELDEEARGLMEAQMFTVMKNLGGAKTLNWRHFVIAAYRLQFTRNPALRGWNRYAAKLRAEFNRFDVDSDGFLEKDEFEALCKTSDAEHNVALRTAFKDPENLKKVEAQFKEIDANFDNVLSFEEYLLWRWFGENDKTIPGPWFKQAPDGEDDYEELEDDFSGAADLRKAVRVYARTR